MAMYGAAQRKKLANITEEDLKKVREGAVAGLGEDVKRTELHQDPFVNGELEMESKNRIEFKSQKFKESAEAREHLMEQIV